MIYSYLIPLVVFLAENSFAAEFTPISFKKSDFKQVRFDDIPHTEYKFLDDRLEMNVKKSSSFILMPFEKVQVVKGFKFDWKLNGKINVASAKMEKSKKGDDFPFRIGLVLSGKAPFVPFFAPSWVKAIRDIAKLPSDKIIYFVVGSLNSAGSKWVSPYTDSINYVSIPSTKNKIWNSVDFSMDPLKVVGIWLMADGDNTSSSFNVSVRNLKIEMKAAN